MSTDGNPNSYNEKREPNGVYAYPRAKHERPLLTDNDKERFLERKRRADEKIALAKELMRKKVGEHGKL